MQTYPLKIVGAAGPVVMVDGNLFVYESATATPPTGDTRIRVKPESGEEIVLRPGQRFRIPDKRASRWNVSSYDGTTNIDGMLIIGAGEFDDANTLNKVTLDATFANVVEVSNTTAKRVPVTLDVAQTMPVSIAGTINTSGALVSYTHKYNANSASNAGEGIQMLAAAANTNGAILEKFDLLSSGASSTGVVSILAKATQPGSAIDGDVLFCGTLGMVMSELHLDVAKNGRVKVPAGKGIWYFSQYADGNMLRNALFTVL